MSQTTSAKKHMLRLALGALAFALHTSVQQEKTSAEAMYMYPGSSQASNKWIPIEQDKTTRESRQHASFVMTQPNQQQQQHQQAPYQAMPQQFAQQQQQQQQQPSHFMSQNVIVHQIPHTQQQYQPNNVQAVAMQSLLKQIAGPRVSAALPAAASVTAAAAVVPPPPQPQQESLGASNKQRRSVGRQASQSARAALVDEPEDEDEQSAADEPAPAPRARSRQASSPMRGVPAPPPRAHQVHAAGSANYRSQAPSSGGGSDDERDAAPAASANNEASGGEDEQPPDEAAERKEAEAAEAAEALAADKSALDEQQQAQREIILAQAQSEARAIKEQQEALLWQQRLQQQMLMRSRTQNMNAIANQTRADSSDAIAERRRHNNNHNNNGWRGTGPDDNARGASNNRRAKSKVRLPASRSNRLDYDDDNDEGTPPQQQQQPMQTRGKPRIDAAGYDHPDNGMTPERRAPVAPSSPDYDESRQMPVGGAQRHKHAAAAANAARRAGSHAATSNAARRSYESRDANSGRLTMLDARHLGAELAGHASRNVFINPNGFDKPRRQARLHDDDRHDRHDSNAAASLANAAASRPMIQQRMQQAAAVLGGDVGQSGELVLGLDELNDSSSQQQMTVIEAPGGKLNSTATSCHKQQQPQPLSAAASTTQVAASAPLATNSVTLLSTQQQPVVADTKLNATAAANQRFAQPASSELHEAHEALWAAAQLQHLYGPNFGHLHSHQTHYHQYVESKAKGHLKAGFKRGGKKFHISGHMKQKKHEAHGHVKWRAKKGHGAHYWHLKHADKKKKHG